jgi:hypothetical protein
MVRHERSDANLRAVVIFALSLTALLFVVHLLLHWMFEGLEKRRDLRDPGLPAVAKERLRFPKDLYKIETLEHAPLLQRDAEYDLQLLRREEEIKLNPPNPEAAVDAKTKTARIPIAEAMRRLEANPKLAASHGIRFREETGRKQKSDGGKQ